VAPYADYEVHGVTGLIVGAAEAADVNGNACTTPAAGGQAGSEPVVSHVQKDGLSWLVQSPAKSTGTSASQPLGVPGDDVTACNQQPDNGLYASADLKLDTTGAARTGGITAVLDHLSILGADPRSWSSTPLVG
jgi:hypothetical protein